MSRQQAIDSLRPLFVLQYFAENEVNAYVDVIVEACGWINGLHFNEVVKELVKEIKTNVRLKPAHFIGKYKELAEHRHWGTEPKKVCASCVQGTGLVYIWVRRKGTGESFRAMKPCPTCQGTSTLKEGLEEIPPLETERPFNIADVKPDAARWLFALMEESERDGHPWKIPAEWITQLAEIAGQEMPKAEVSVSVAEAIEDPPEE